MSLSLRRSALAVVLFSALPLLVACPKKDPPPVDAAPPEPEPDTTPTVLEPLEEDAGEEDAGEDAAPAKRTGKPVNTNVARLRQCCAALAKEAKLLGSSPEAGMLQTAATQCTAMAGQVAPGGNAPEMGAIRTILAGRTVPAICRGF
jgi:hypothetical protein